MKKRPGFVVLAVLAIGGALWFWNLPDRVVSESALLEGGTLGVSVSVSGKVGETYVKAGETVAAGQPLFALDKSGYEMQLARERVKLAEIASTIPGDVPVPSPTAAHAAVPGKPLAALRIEEEEARKSVEAASHVLAAANIALARFDSAKPPTGERGASRRQQLLILRDEAALSLKKNKDAYETASYARAQREALDKTLLSSKPVSAALAARIAEYQAQISRVRLAEHNLAATIVLAPEAGKVAFMAARPGVSLAAGDVPVTVVPEKTKDIWVSAFFGLEHAAALKVNRECFVLFPNAAEPVKGFIGAVRPPSEDGKNFAVHIVLDQTKPIPATMIGQDVVAYIVTGRVFFIPGLQKIPYAEYGGITPPYAMTRVL